MHNVDLANSIFFMLMLYWPLLRLSQPARLKWLGGVLVVLVLYAAARPHLHPWAHQFRRQVLREAFIRQTSGNQTVDSLVARAAADGVEINYPVLVTDQGVIEGLQEKEPEFFMCPLLSVLRKSKMGDHLAPNWLAPNWLATFCPGSLPATPRPVDTVGLCVLHSDGTKIIYLSKDYIEGTQNVPLIEKLIAHEIGHCTYYREHTEVSSDLMFEDVDRVTGREEAWSIKDHLDHMTSSSSRI